MTVQAGARSFLSLSWKPALVVLGLCGLAAWVIYLMTAVVWTGSCSAEAFTDNGGLELVCADKHYRVENRGLALSYIRNNGPLLCTVNANGEAHCKHRPFK